MKPSEKAAEAIEKRLARWGQVGTEPGEIAAIIAEATGCDELKARLERVQKLRQEQIDALQSVHNEYTIAFADMLAHRGLQTDADLVRESTAPLVQRIGAVVSRLLRQRDEAEELLEQHHFDRDGLCIDCRRGQPNDAPDCRLAAYLAAVKG